MKIAKNSLMNLDEFQALPWSEMQKYKQIITFRVNNEKSHRNDGIFRLTLQNCGRAHLEKLNPETMRPEFFYGPICNITPQDEKELFCEKIRHLADLNSIDDIIEYKVVKR